MKYLRKAILPILLLALLLSGCVAEPSSSAEDSTKPSNVIPFVPQIHECPQEDPYENVDEEAFYADYTPACCLTDALYRSKHYLMSGSIEVPGQAAVDAKNRPMEGGKYIRNTTAYYADGGSTYIIVDDTGKEVMRIYKGGAYITLEEVAAYMYAFGGSANNIPANYTANKKMKPTESQWGEYLRLNHTKFSGDTVKYPYEPELPDIAGCGGDLQYFEMDIGTTGCKTAGNYATRIYNDGNFITRGSARLVYARQDKNRNGTFEKDEVYVFYTDNHYNDFREYLNYYGGWGEIFGNITGGGTHSSKSHYNPTPYVPTAYQEFVYVDIDQAA